MVILLVPVIFKKSDNFDVKNKDFYLREFFEHGLLKRNSTLRWQTLNMTNFSKSIVIKTSQPKRNQAH